MKYSLINICKQNQNKIDGYWLQDHIGTLDSAKEIASRTEQINSNKIKVAIVEEVRVPNPLLQYFTDLVQLNV